MGLNGTRVNEDEIARTLRSGRAGKSVTLGTQEQWTERKRAQAIADGGIRLPTHRTERQRDQTDAIDAVATASVEAERHPFQSERSCAKLRAKVIGHAGFA